MSETALVFSRWLQWDDYAARIKQAQYAAALIAGGYDRPMISNWDAYWRNEGVK